MTDVDSVREFRKFDAVRRLRRLRHNTELFLCANRTGRVSGISPAVWDFSVSGYRLLFRWLDARQGLAVDHSLTTALRDVVGRIAELIDLFARADQVLARTLAATLSRDALGLAGAEPAAVDEQPNA